MRSEAYLSYIRTLPCLVHRRPGVEAHHYQRTGDKGLSLKTGDEWAVPVCKLCHDAIHMIGNEQSFWAIAGVDPVAWAEKTWSEWNDLRERQG